MENDSLYLALKNKLCEMIYQGIYKEGENIPPERTLAENLQVSRVTVRKGLHLLEKDGIIERVQGSGTQIRLPKWGYGGTMDIIALVAPPGKPFFATFIDYFQKDADDNQSLVLFMQNPQQEKVENSLFKLFQKNIRNVVVWLEDLEVDLEYIKRLRGLGMNIVFFDIEVLSDYADCVLIDNQHALGSLFHYVKERQSKNIFYLGWDNQKISSVRERETAFIRLSQGLGEVLHMSWKKRHTLVENMRRLAVSLKVSKNMPDAVICGDGELGIACRKIFLEEGLEDVLVVSVDDFKEAEEIGLSVYRQSYLKMAQKVYTCLKEQNQHPKVWQAAVYKIEGEIIKRWENE